MKCTPEIDQASSQHSLAGKRVALNLAVAGSIPGQDQKTTFLIKN
jgi:hypothetical protein